jgi:glycine cleavage system H protein
MNFPKDLRYTKEHEWARIDGNTVTIGVTDHAQSSLGDVVFVELPKVGRELRAGETFGVVESIKAVSDLYSPVAGKVVAVNDPLIHEPALVNSSAYDQAWMIRVQVSDAALLSELMDAAAYEKYVASLN